jgi:hypothetical protein
MRNDSPIANALDIFAGARFFAGNIVAAKSLAVHVRACKTPPAVRQTNFVFLPKSVVLSPLFVDMPVTVDPSQSRTNQTQYRT